MAKAEFQSGKFDLRTSTHNHCTLLLCMQIALNSKHILLEPTEPGSTTYPPSALPPPSHGGSANEEKKPVIGLKYLRESLISEGPGCIAIPYVP